MLKFFFSTTTQKSSQSFIMKAKVAGANALLGQFTSIPSRFDYCLKEMIVTEIAKGKVVCTIPVTEGLTNSYGTLHGGATSTIVDVIGTMALLSIDPTRPGVSVEMNTSFTSSAPLGEMLVIQGTALKTGRKLGFTEVQIRRQSDDILVATGRHTKAL